MKKILVPFFILTTYFLINCDSTKQATQLKMMSPQAGASLKKGESLVIKLEIPNSLQDSDSIIYLIDGLQISEHRDSDSINVDTETLGFGQKTIGAKVYKNGLSESVFSNVVILPQNPKRYGFKVVEEYPHDPAAFTQGLEFKNGFLYESTGQYEGLSSLRKTELKTGKVLQKINLGNEFFGEGMTIVDNKIIQLTWLENKAFVYDVQTFQKIGEFTYSGHREGWGLAYDGQHLILSDGTENLYFIDPHNYQYKNTLKVYNQSGPVKNLNELEYIDGKLYANVYQTDNIVIIDPTTGAVEGEINLIGIYPDRPHMFDYELNGIAIEKNSKKIFVTGKKWSKLFHIELIEL